jgi:hypothetical protein
MPAAGATVYFADENALGLGKLLRRSGRTDVVSPGLDELPEIPRGTEDLVWLPIVGDREHFVLTRERRIRSRPAELRAYHEHGVRSVWIGAKTDLGSREQFDMFVRHEARLQREIVKRGPGPWALALTPTGLSPLELRENPAK